MGRRNVQGEDIPWPRTKTLGNSRIPVSVARCHSRLGSTLTAPPAQSIIHPCMYSRTARCGGRGASCLPIRLKLGGHHPPSFDGPYRGCRRPASGHYHPVLRPPQFTNKEPTKPSEERSMSSIRLRLKTSEGKVEIERELMFTQPPMWALQPPGREDNYKLGDAIR